MAGIRTVMVTISPLLGEIIERQLQTRLQLDVVARLANRRNLAERLRRLAPAMIILGSPSRRREQVAAIAAGATVDACVVVMAVDAARVSIYRAGELQCELLDPSAGELIAALAESLGLDRPAETI